MILTETLPDVSTKYKTLASACVAAQELSNRYRDWFFHVFWNNSGFYHVDYLGIKYSDEKILQTFYRNEQQL
jgi:hypothetical protein